jgi:hypothetical protein
MCWRLQRNVRLVTLRGPASNFRLAFREPNQIFGEFGNSSGRTALSD